MTEVNGRRQQHLASAVFAVGLEGAYDCVLVIGLFFSPFNLLSLVILLAVGIVSSIALLISSSFAGWEAFLLLYFVESFIFLSYQLDRMFHPQYISPWFTIFL